MPARLSTRLSWYYQTMVWLSGIGLLATAAWHILVLLGVDVPRTAWMPLEIGMFVVWFPAVISALPLNAQIRNARGGTWKILLQGAPTWMYLTALYLGIYAAVNWVLATGDLSRVTSNDAAFPRVGSGVTMLFYAVAMAILYSSGARENAVQCSEGHWIYPGQAKCPTCGQPREDVTAGR
jgi:hypothetical protein